jgi:hypothetical protein
MRAAHRRVASPGGPTPGSLAVQACDTLLQGRRGCRERRHRFWRMRAAPCHQRPDASPANGQLDGRDHSDDLLLADERTTVPVGTAEGGQFVLAAEQLTSYAADGTSRQPGSLDCVVVLVHVQTRAVSRRMAIQGSSIHNPRLASPRAGKNLRTIAKEARGSPWQSSAIGPLTGVTSAQSASRWSHVGALRPRPLSSFQAFMTGWSGLVLLAAFHHR